MQVDSNYRELLQCFVGEQVRFLVVGGYAMIKHSEPYLTKDLDLWIEPSHVNAERALRALTRFGAPVLDVTVGNLLDPELIYQVGVEPVRVDIMCSISGLEFEAAWAHRDSLKYGDVTVSVLSLEDTILTKKATGRPKDLLQAEELEKIAAERRNEG